ncbi:asparagine synthase (glutamine-hydrolyzing) [Rhodocyclus purpureus]|uniref:asparagine synthase (glutamine-hydrolyzing) n=1 Tax=Rhodocyclus purpureus TaxID=1067 RepID=UPI001911C900|nr:asparagine synthase (glutamine-hydrolyzing) [Rhodocyclus purpureus]MBK5915546.1 asparagine synthase (glutamine-hydrolyzing) [Rhodocyclus purpureus]
MCGLAGIFPHAETAPPVNREELLRIRERMRARGPDAAGLWISEDHRIGLAHRRLAIIDLTAEGAQPMASADGRYQIVFNGEIYNYRELKADLQTQGVPFRSHSDTEVLLQLYAREGKAMLHRLRGMYAFAIWDTQEQSLFLARDPFGIKPLYLHDDGKTLRFASQVKALLAGGAIARDIDPEGELGYWIWGHIPEPHTLYKNIRAFEPGTWLKLHRNGRRETGTFETVANLLMLENEPSSRGPTADSATQQHSLREALLDSVRHHLIADVPVGVFLSAGIDSTTLAALAAECGGTLHTVTLGFEEYRGTSSDESVLAEQVARQYGAQHQTVWISRDDFQDAFAEFIDAMDQPSFDGLNTWLVSRAAAQLGLKVAISGLGGDEFFGGYPSFRQIPQIRHLARPFAPIPGLGKLTRQVSAPLLRRFTSEKYAGLLEYGATWQGAYLLRRALRMPWELKEHSPEDRALRVIRHCQPSETISPLADHAVVSCLEASNYMRNQLLRDSDWAGMAHSIELRVPLVDVELTRHIAWQRKAGLPYSKQDLAGAARPALPSEIVNRPKTGFTVPVRDWMRPNPASQAKQPERGLRGWQQVVMSSFLHASEPGPA